MFTGVVSYAQQDAQFTQYMYNTLNVNPAYAGSRGVLSIFGLHRTQWVGLDGAPVTNAFTVHSPIGESRLGLGLEFLTDRIGPTKESNITADVSYTIPTSESYKLSFGVKVTGNFFSLDESMLTPQEQNDPNLQGVSNQFSPNIGAGVYFHGDKFYAGLSVPNFIETTRYSDNDRKINQERLNYYFITGYVFDLSPSLKFKPALMTKLVMGAPLQIDVSGNFLINEKFVIGAAYRWSAAMSAMVGFQVTDALFLGYGYDLETTELNNYNDGSHEIFLRYELFNRYDRITTPRFF